MAFEQSRSYGWLLRHGMDWFGRGRLAQTGGQIRLPGLKSRVEVFRDRWGVPHIYASCEEDLFFAQGFVHAQDRFWQMEFQRRLVAGRLAEVLGEPAVSADRWMRVLGMRRVAEIEAGLITGSAGQVLESYADGVNAYLQNHRLPVEFALLRYTPEPWTVADSLSWSKMMAWMLASNWECELLRGQLIEKLGADLADQLELGAEECWPLVLELPDSLAFGRRLAQMARAWTGPSAREGVGSNNWVVSGSRTVSGMPILANDMHLLLNAPSVLYENHLAGEGFNVSGISLPGLPLVIAGHNGRVAWGFTAGFADVQDLYEERLRESPEHGWEYEFRGEWRPAGVRREEIRVRGSASFTQEVITTHHGPVVTPLLEGESTTPLALCWTAYETSGGTFAAVIRMNRARNCLEFREAMRTWNAPVLNAVYADVEGNIAYTLAGKIPIRAQGDGRAPVPGWSGAYEWTGYIPYDELPHLYNPESGYIATANNRVAGPDYPYWLGCDYISGDRAERIIELILSRPKIDVDYVKQMQLDQVSPTAQTFAQVVGQLEVGPDLQPVVDLLRDWDGALTADSPAAAVYEALSNRLLLIMLEGRLGNLMPRYAGKLLHELSGGGAYGHHAREWLRRQLLRPDSPWFDLGGGETRDDVLCMALRETVDLLTEEQGPKMDDWQWGWFHKLTFQHVLGRQKPLDAIFNRGPYPIGGDGQTIWATNSLMDRLDSSEGVVGPPSRFIADLSDLNCCWGQLVPGQSGQVGSRHYDDQIDDWFKGEYHPMYFRREDVERERESCLELLP